MYDRLLEFNDFNLGIGIFLLKAYKIYIQIFYKLLKENNCNISRYLYKHPLSNGGQGQLHKSKKMSPAYSYTKQLIQGINRNVSNVKLLPKKDPKFFDPTVSKILIDKIL